ncbi:MAG: hypothetical protein JXN61_08845 [Sedimentisphaerales bacterium]|nr:hypothetical protein [Sedimentisphaerales bacterium]
MFNFFEQPYTLIGLAVIVLFGLFTFRSVFPEKRSPRQWLIPLSIVALAFALDLLVRTDREKLNALISTLMKAVQEENHAAIEPLIAVDYQDSHHRTKAELMARCRKTLADIYIHKNKLRSCLLQISPPAAKATIFTTTTFDQKSWVAQSYKSFLFFKGEIFFARQSDGSWRVTRINPLEVDKQPITWSQIRQ